MSGRSPAWPTTAWVFSDHTCLPGSISWSRLPRALLAFGSVWRGMLVYEPVDPYRDGGGTSKGVSHRLGRKSSNADYGQVFRLGEGNTPPLDSRLRGNDGYFRWEVGLQALLSRSRQNALGVTRQALSDLVNGKAGVSVEMSFRLSQAFGSTPETWLGMQTAYDLWQARERAKEIEVEDFKTAALT